MILCLVKTLIAWAILMLLGTNLIGFIMRGLLGQWYWTPPAWVDETTDRVKRELYRREYRRVIIGNIAITIFFVVLTVGYLVALCYFWNIGLAVAATLIMALRFPDLIWEIRTGKKVTRGNLPLGSMMDIVALILYPGSLVLVWYSLYRW